MHNLTELSKKNLVAIQLGRNHETVHKAWQDDTNQGFLICYEIGLVFDDQTSYVIEPDEVNVKGQYPALGLSLCQKNLQSLTSSFKVPNLPQRVGSVVQDDYLGENAINQYILKLTSGEHIIIRHVFPPMSMGIKLEPKNA